MKLTCADPNCDRAPMRARDGQRWCMWHPDQSAPQIDLLSGKLRGPNGKPKKDFKPSEILRPSAEVAERAARRPRATVARAPRPQQPAPADGLCPACPLPWRHRGRHSTALDAAEAARRYQAGEGLFSLAAALHVGANTLRKALHDQGVTLRSRGDVIGTRGVPPTPLDETEVRRLYAAGHTTVEIGRSLGARGTRVADILRAHGELRAPGHRAAPRPATDLPRRDRPARLPREQRTGICPQPLCGKADGHGGAHHTGWTEQVVTKVTPDTDTAMRAWAAELDQSVSEYLRSLIHADLAAQGRLEQAS